MDKRFGYKTGPRIDRSGQKFHEWTLIDIAGVRRYPSNKGGGNTVVWFYNAKCSCGGIYKVGWPDILSSKSKRCKICSNKLFLVDSQKGIKRFGKSNSNYKGSADIPGNWLTRIKSNAKARNLVCGISLEDLQAQWVKQEGRCFYTGISLNFNTSKNKDVNNHISCTASLDRIDSDKGYCLDNIAWTSKTVNKLKMDLPNHLFLQLCKMVYIHNKGKI